MTRLETDSISIFIEILLLLMIFKWSKRTDSTNIANVELGVVTVNLASIIEVLVPRVDKITGLSGTPIVVS
jgi:hypothetical protein